MIVGDFDFHDWLKRMCNTPIDHVIDDVPNPDKDNIAHEDFGRTIVLRSGHSIWVSEGLFQDLWISVHEFKMEYRNGVNPSWGKVA